MHALPVVRPHTRHTATHGTNLPHSCVTGYANWGQCDDKIVQAAKDGVNLIIWFSINLAAVNNVPTITGPATGT